MSRKKRRTLCIRAKEWLDGWMVSRGWHQSRRSLVWHYSNLCFEQIAAMLPITLLQVLVLAIFFHKSSSTPATDAAGLIAAVAGLVLFLEGLRVAIMPLAVQVGTQLPLKLKLPWVLLVAFCLGVLVTYAEPAIAAIRPLALLVDAQSAPYLYFTMNVQQEIMVLAVGIGVGVAAVVGTLKFLHDISIKILIAASLLPTVAAACYMQWGNPALAPILGVAWDCGGVTTGPVTVPILLSLGVGVMKAQRKKKLALAVLEDAAVNKREGNVLEGFGIVTLASLLPVLAVEVMAILTSLTYSHDYIVEQATLAAAKAANEQPKVTESSPVKEVLYGIRAITPLIAGLLLLVTCVLKQPPHLVGFGIREEEENDQGTKKKSSSSSLSSSASSAGADAGDAVHDTNDQQAAAPAGPAAASNAAAAAAQLSAAAVGKDAAIADAECSELAPAAEAAAAAPGRPPWHHHHHHHHHLHQHLPPLIRPARHELQQLPVPPGAGDNSSRGGRQPNGSSSSFNASLEDDNAASAAAGATGPTVAQAVIAAADEEVLYGMEISLPPKSEFDKSEVLDNLHDIESAAGDYSQHGTAASAAGQDSISRGSWWQRFQAWLRGGGFGLLGALLMCQIGMILFNLGLTYGFTALGDATGSTLPAAFLALPYEPGSPYYSFAGGVALTMVVLFLLGILATRAEPALNVLGDTVETLSNRKFTKQLLIWAVSIGVAAGMAAGACKILFQVPLMYFILGKYSLAVALTVVAKEAITCVAWDSAGVTTGPVTVPFVMAIGVGFSKAVGAPEGFGMLTVMSVVPIISVLITSLMRKPVKKAATELARLSKVSATNLARISRVSTDQVSVSLARMSANLSKVSVSLSKASVNLSKVSVNLARVSRVTDSNAPSNAPSSTFGAHAGLATLFSLDVGQTLPQLCEHSAATGTGTEQPPAQQDQQQQHDESEDRHEQGNDDSIGDGGSSSNNCSQRASSSSSRLRVSPSHSLDQTGC